MCITLSIFSFYPILILFFKLITIKRLTIKGYFEIKKINSEKKKFEINIINLEFQ